MAKMVIKSVGIASLAKWTALVMAVFTLVTTVVFSLFFGVFARSLNDLAINAGEMTATRFTLLFMMINGIIGFVGAIASGLIYNAVAGKQINPVEIEMESAPANYDVPYQQ